MTTQKDLEYNQNQLEIIRFLLGDCLEEYSSSFFVGCLNGGNMKEMKYNTSNIEKISDLKFSTRCDYYITANSIKNNCQRQKKELFGLHNICIDIDLHNSKDNINKVAENLKYFLVEGDCSIPLLNVFVKTGRGVQLWWHFEETSSKLLFMYQAVTQFIINQLNDLIQAVETLSNLKIDVPASQNIVGYFRLPFTTNTKTSTLAFAEILNSDTYNLVDVFNDYCDNENVTISLQNVQHVGQNKNVATRLWKPQSTAVEYISLIMKRKQFIEQYCINRNYRVTGSRDLIMFLYCVCLVQVMNIDFVMPSMKKFNAQFTEPLEQSKLDEILGYMQRKGILKFRNETFLSFLPFSVEERSRYLTVKEHNGTRDIKRKITKEERNQNIIKLAIDGKTTEQIAQEVNCSVRTVKSVLKFNNFNRPDLLKSKIMELISQGLSLRQIACKLNISYPTVQKYSKI
ncbi:MAG: LuxR C-terminal-related transcriptional regulator [Oscillospiraceae bacterium]|nr:LuxR C-terminal-related transcriptional regulator [Oscillospiraceae bacterium]